MPDPAEQVPTTRHSVENSLSQTRALSTTSHSESTSSSLTGTAAPVGPASKPRDPPIKKKAPTNTAAGPKTFAFVNISDPSQSGNADKRKFVRQYVRPVKKEKGERSRVPEVAAMLETGSLPFIVMSHPDQGSNAGTRKFVKQNAQRRFRKGKARAPLEELEDLEESELIIEHIPAEQGPKVKLDNAKKRSMALRLKGLKSHQVERRFPPLGELSNIVASSNEHPELPVTNNIWNFVDMSGAIFPIKMTPADYRIVEYLHTSSDITKVPPAFIPLWFGLILRDKSAFQGLLSLALGQQSQCHKLPTQQAFIKYRSQALTSVQESLADSSQHESSGLLTSIIIFLMHDILECDGERYAINRAGLRSLITLRGGIQKLDSFFEQRLFIVVAEVCGAITFNYTPEYYIPDAFLHTPPRVSPIPMTNRVLAFVRTWLLRYPSQTEITNVFSDHYAVNAEVVLDCPNIWKRPSTLGPEIYLVIVRYLYILNHVDLSRPTATLEEALCIASILYLNHIRDALGDYFTVVSHDLVKRLMQAVFPESEEWLGLDGMRLWCLVQGGIVSEGRDRMRFLEKTRQVMRMAGCRNWYDAVGIVVELIYVEQLFGRKCREFGEDVMTDWR